MAEAVGRTESSRWTRIYEWKTGIRQLDLPALLAYARLTGVSTDVLIDDEMDLCLEEWQWIFHRNWLSNSPRTTG